MTKYLAGILSVLTAGVLLVAYALLSPRAAALNYPSQNPYATPATYAYGAQSGFGSNGAMPCANAVPINYPYGVPYATPVSAQQSVRSEDIVERTPVRRQVATRTVVRAPRRDWKKTALVVGGSTATAAGIGGLVGGKKGALVGAALGGGISTLYETTKK